MNRRGFLKGGLLGAIGAAIAIAMPSVLKPDPVAAVVEPIGLPTYVEEPHNHSWFGRHFIKGVDCPPDRIYFTDLSKIQRDSFDGSFHIDAKDARSFSS